MLLLQIFSATIPITMIKFWALLLLGLASVNAQVPWDDLNCDCGCVNTDPETAPCDTQFDNRRFNKNAQFTNPSCRVTQISDLPDCSARTIGCDTIWNCCSDNGNMKCTVTADTYDRVITGKCRNYKCADTGGTCCYDVECLCSLPPTIPQMITTSPTTKTTTAEPAITTPPVTTPVSITTPRRTTEKQITIQPTTTIRPTTTSQPTTTEPPTTTLPIITHQQVNTQKTTTHSQTPSTTIKPDEDNTDKTTTKQQPTITQRAQTEEFESTPLIEIGTKQKTATAPEGKDPTPPSKPGTTLTTSGDKNPAKDKPSKPNSGTTFQGIDRYLLILLFLMAAIIAIQV